MKFHIQKTLYESSKCQLRLYDVTKVHLFLLITFDRSMIRASQQHHCISLVNTDRMLCNMTYLGQVMTLTWGQISYMTFLAHIIYHSTCLDELNIMVVKSLTYLFGVQSYHRKTKSAILTFHDLWRPNRWPEVKSENTSRKYMEKGYLMLFSAPS